MKRIQERIKITTHAILIVILLHAAWNLRQQQQRQRQIKYINIYLIYR